MNYILHLLICLSMYVIASLSLNIVMGYAGLFSLAHASYLAVGAYTYAVLSIHGVGFVPALLLAIGVSSLLSLAVSIPAWRYRGDFFVLASLATQALISSVLYNWVKAGDPPGTLSNLTNGPSGIAGIHKPVIFGVGIDTMPRMAALSILLALLCVAFARVLLKSPFGRMMQSLRDDELAARALGKNMRLVKLQACAISCGLIAIAGVIYAFYQGYLDPSSSASLDFSILIACMAIVGGTGNLWGPIVGAAILLLLQEAPKFLPLSNSIAPNVRLIVYGVLLLFLMHLRPQGVAGKYRFE